MSEKARQFRSLLLEPLECRSVFSADGLDVWQFSQSSFRFEFDRFQPAQYPQNKSASLSDDSRRDNNLGHSKDFSGVKYFEGRSSHGSPKFGSSVNRGRFDNVPLPPAESEDTSAGTISPSLDSKPALNLKDVKPNPEPTTVQVPTQLSTNRITIVLTSGPINSPSVTPGPVTRGPGGLTLSHDIPLVGGPTRTQFDSPSSEKSSDLPTGNSTVNSSRDRVPSSLSQNPLSTVPTQIPTALNSSAPLTNSTGQASLVGASARALSTSASGTTTFDFSSQISKGVGVSDSLARPWGDEFRFTRPIPTPPDVMNDQTRVEQSSAQALLENLVSGLAENHRRNRMQHAFDANQPSSSDEQNRRPEASESVDVMFADGGMIALALNRDIAMNELKELSEEARSEGKAWVANVGIFRAFENGAVAATEYAGLNNRVTRNGISSSSPQEVTEVEGEVANSHYHPLLASTSAVLGVVLLGLRRMRRNAAPLLFTSRKA